MFEPLIATNEGHCLKQLRELYSNNGIYYGINYPQNLLDFATSVVMYIAQVMVYMYSSFYMLWLSIAVKTSINS